MAGDLINGEIPEHWEFTTLGDVCQRGGGNIQTGPFGSQLHASDYVQVGVPSIMPTNIGENRIVEDGIVRITEEDANRLAQHRVRAGDIVYSRRGDVEKRSLIREHEEGWLCGTGCLKVRLGTGVVDPLFASLFLGHPAIKDWIVRHAVGATMPNLNTSIMSAVPFALPPPAEQKTIAAVLGALDDKIELNRRMNATLEAMARALFQSWFVDFDPVRAKLDGRKPIGLDKATSALFSAHFEHATDGVVPKGWTRKRWGDIATLEYGKSLRDYRESCGKYRVFGTNGPIGFHDEPLCNSAGIVIGRKGAYRGVHYSPEPFFVIDTAFYLKPQAGLDLKWAYYELVRFDINSMDSGSAIPSTSRDDFYGIPVIVPPPQIQGAFGKIVSGWFATMFANDHQSRTLAVLRDTLLPKLLSGEVAVSSKLKTQISS
ncbi:restriction endonuclease subunit S [Prosthecobacter sp.]|uniref:restriction endonuclease subunit S n=1 Tax=Prosthecobacter sp. TaxID=1965333 RepID=UPI00248A8039|nr:restriction endonuclease subunit S [Prosthecobacter sp.]MDI1313365.1 restriction endonuclease subunit S [Prosthecobacter sp.]